MTEDVERDGQVCSLLLDLFRRAVVIDSPASECVSFTDLASMRAIREVENAPEKVHKQADSRRQAVHVDEPDLNSKAVQRSVPRPHESEEKIVQTRRTFRETIAMRRWIWRSNVALSTQALRDVSYCVMNGRCKRTSRECKPSSHIQRLRCRLVTSDVFVSFAGVWSDWMHSSRIRRYILSSSRIVV